MNAPSVPHLVDPAGQYLVLQRPTTLLGRAEECHVVIADRRASRHHAEITALADTANASTSEEPSSGYMLRDLASTNGTWLNGQRISAPERLRNGDVIEIAEARFMFCDPDATVDAATFPKVVVEEATGEVWIDRCPVHLSGKQRALFLLLWRRRGHVCTKDEIAEAVWPECRGEVYDYQIESLIKRLRAKLEPHPHAPVLIVNEPELGYKLAI